MDPTRTLTAKEYGKMSREELVDYTYNLTNKMKALQMAREDDIEAVMLGAQKTMHGLCRSFALALIALCIAAFAVGSYLGRL